MSRMKLKRILYVRNLPSDVTIDEIYELFREFGDIIQIRMGVLEDFKGTAFIIFNKVEDSIKALEELTGASYKKKFLIILFFEIQLS
mmetsp:Transcript_29501/g.51812  ORF Transcript_29501/g.51812 Transcript_29501/m.51812 type:complete len:87 (+) Transcript_29501:876-1136(+)